MGFEIGVETVAQRRLVHGLERRCPRSLERRHHGGLATNLVGEVSQGVAGFLKGRIGSCQQGLRSRALQSQQAPARLEKPPPNVKRDEVHVRVHRPRPHDVLVQRVEVRGELVV